MKRKRVNVFFKFLVIFLFVAMLSPCIPARAEKCSLRWFALPQARYAGGAYPEWSATYFAYTFRNFENKDKVLEFKADFPHARYMSFVLYNWPTGEMLGQMLDQDIIADSGSVNPFEIGVPRNSDSRAYTISLVQEGNTREHGPNTITIPEKVKNGIILMRVYLPDQDCGDRGCVRLPTVTAYDDASGTETDCPAVLPSENVFDSTDPPEPVAEEKLNEQKIVFYRPYPVKGEELFANGENPYLAAPLLKMSRDKVALVRFKAPTFPKTLAGAGEFVGDEDVRYWSVCMGGLENGSTSECFYDEGEETVIDEDGWVNVAIGPAAFCENKPVAGWNYIPWGLHDRPVLMIRQIEPQEDFEGNFKRVPVTYGEYDPDVEESEVNEKDTPADIFKAMADDFINANYEAIGDYSPKGIYCDRSAFRNGQCVID